MTTTQNTGYFSEQIQTFGDLADVIIRRIERDERYSGRTEIQSAMVDAIHKAATAISDMAAIDAYGPGEDERLSERQTFADELLRLTEELAQSARCIRNYAYEEVAQ